jgi:hypothetical protein
LKISITTFLSDHERTTAQVRVEEKEMVIEGRRLRRIKRKDRRKKRREKKQQQ